MQIFMVFILSFQLSIEQEMFEDIRIAVNLWSRPDETGCSASGNFYMGCDYVLLLLYHVADLLSIKVH